MPVNSPFILKIGPPDIPSDAPPSIKISPLSSIWSVL